MNKFESYVISVECSDIDESDLSSHSHRSKKYKLRREYVKNSLIPSFKDICHVKIFDAVTPKNFYYVQDKLIYNNKLFTRGVDRNYNKFSGNFATANTLGFYELFSVCKNKNISLLLLEDDALLPSKNILNIKKSIQEFLTIEDPAILYLQSECPWRKGFPIKYYPEDILLESGEILYKIKYDWFDIAGVACFMINPKGAEKLLDVIHEHGVFNSDQVTTFAMNRKMIDVYVSRDYENMVMLNKELQ